MIFFPVRLLNIVLNILCFHFFLFYFILTRLCCLHIIIWYMYILLFINQVVTIRKTWVCKSFLYSMCLMRFIVFLCSVKVSAGQVQYECVLHPRWLHLGGSKPLPARSGPLLSGCDEGVSSRFSASGIYSSLTNTGQWCKQEGGALFILQGWNHAVKQNKCTLNKARIVTSLTSLGFLVCRSLNHIYLLWQKKLTGTFRVSWSQWTSPWWSVVRAELER